MHIFLSRIGYFTIVNTIYYSIYYTKIGYFTIFPTCNSVSQIYVS